MVYPITFKRTIRRSGGSAMVALPPEIMEGLGWDLGDEVTISVTQDKAILIEKKA